MFVNSINSLSSTNNKLSFTAGNPSGKGSKIVRRAVKPIETIVPEKPISLWDRIFGGTDYTDENMRPTLPNPSDSAYDGSGL